MSPFAEDPFDAASQPLRDDVRRLGALLGEILLEQGGAGLYATVEAVRLASRRRRNGDPEAEAQLGALLEPLDVGTTQELVRAFSAYFFIVNMAERIHRIRRALAREAAGQAQSASWSEVIGRLIDDGADAADLVERLRRMRLHPVFTAHPTEATPRALLVKEQRIARALVAGLTFDTEDAALPLMQRVRNELTAAWQTDEHLSERPTVAEEVEHIVFYLSEVIYRIVPRFYKDLEQALLDAGAPPADAGALAPLLSFGSWVGGDMDGNPNVGPDTIRETFARHRELVLRHYRDEMRELFGYLTQSATMVGIDGALQDRIAECRRLYPDIDAEIDARFRAQPYRVMLWFISRRIEFTATDAVPQRYPNPDEFLADLRLIESSLLANRGEHAGAYLVRRLILRAQTFGFHLAALDIRQHAGVHRQAVGELLGVAGFADMPGHERTRILANALGGAPATGSAQGEAASRCLAVQKALSEVRERYGERAVGIAIVSMAQGPDDALAVLYLARHAGGQAPDIAPLFETVDDLVNARATLEALWADPMYREHLASRGDEQFVMLGYSDSGKDSGIAASRRALHSAQIQIVEAAAVAGLKVTLFHGRGGSISRGGGRPREAILAEPAGAIDGRLRLTEQGEIIHAKYGLRGLALRTLEIMGGATLEQQMEAGADDAPWHEAFDLVADASRRHYRELVYGSDEFVAFFRAATPVDVIERMPIGSRPARRSGQAGIEDLRAIPWVFAWTQSRNLLPGWFGAGRGLEAAEQALGIDLLREMLAHWPVFENLVSDVEMALAKADLDIARRYAALAGTNGEPLFARMQEEFLRCRDMICRLRGADDLLSTDPVLRRALYLRNPYVDPMSFVQIELLQRWRAGGREDPALERALIATVHGIARGMQNTG